MKLDTTNSRGITAHQGRVVAVLPVGQSWTAEDAVRLAAWLIVGAELCLAPGSDVDALQDAIDTVKAIRES